MTKQLPALLISVILIISACKKSNNYHFAPITGNWRYTNSTADTLVNGQWKAPNTYYDGAFTATFADSLQFTATDTLYYTYGGITTWSNYDIRGNQLDLIGSGTTNTLNIYSLTATTLQVGTQSPNYSYVANYTKY